MAFVQTVLQGRPGKYRLKNGTVVQVPESGTAIVWDPRIARGLVRLGMEIVTNPALPAVPETFVADERALADEEEDEAEEDEDEGLPIVDSAGVIALDDTPTGGLVMTTETLDGVARRPGGRKRG